MYKFLYSTDIFCLPQSKTLKRLTSALKVDSVLSGPTMTYLKLRVDQLEPKERLANLAMDDVYTAQTVDFLVAEFSNIISKNSAVSMKSLHPGKCRRGFVVLMRGSSNSTTHPLPPSGKLGRRAVRGVVVTCPPAKTEATHQHANAALKTVSRFFGIWGQVRLPQ